MSHPTRLSRPTTGHRATRQTSANTQNQPSEVTRGEYCGLSSEEIRILRTIKEEHRQRGGFVRIFPTGDTYEFFSSFFEQRTTSYNQMVHQRLYPSRWTANTFNAQQNGQQIRRTTVPRHKHLCSAFNYGHPTEKDLTPKTNGCDLDEALQRFRIYERRLVDIVPPAAPVPTTINDNSSKSSVVVDTVESEPVNIHRTTNNQPTAKRTSKDMITVGHLVKEQQFNWNPPPGQTRHSLYVKNELVQMLNQGLTLRSERFSC